MRPDGASDGLELSSSPSIDRPNSASKRPVPTPRHSISTAPTTFFLRSEEELEQQNDSPPESAQSSTYGIRSLASAVSYADHAPEAGRLSPDLKPKQSDMVPGNALTSQDPSIATIALSESNHELAPRMASSATNLSPSKDARNVKSKVGPKLPFSLAGLSLNSPLIESAPTSTPRSSSLRSFRLSDEESGAEDTTSQAVTSGGEEEEDEEIAVQEQSEQSQHSQLVMPSIRMPTRRPFTERGKHLGKLKVLVAGGKGVGKSSLIKSVVQVCEDIVHVDPHTNVPLSLNVIEQPTTHSSRPHKKPLMLETFVETHASTRAYPPWWSDVEESRVLRRRKSMGEIVLERNLTFVDPPEARAAPLGDVLVQHLEGLLQRTESMTSLSEGEILSILSGGGSPQVDVVLYILSKENLPADMNVLKRLAPLTNIIPVISKSDLSTPEEVTMRKRTALSTLASANISHFTFGESLFDLEHPSAFATIFAVSSAPSNESEDMEASLLMSPDYVQPLVPSELAALVARLITPDTTSWLRHSAAKKFLRWRRTRSPPPPHPSHRHIPTTISSPVFHASGTASTSASSIFHPHNHKQPHDVTTARPGLGLESTTSPYTSARLQDHTQREERLAQVRLARWAADLQRALHNERSRFEQLQHDERASWLAERLEECDSTAYTPNKEAQSPSSSSLTRKAFSMNTTDPLGLLDWDDRLRARALLLMKVVGGCSFVGAVAVWVLRTSGYWNMEGGATAQVSQIWPWNWAVADVGFRSLSY